jgi:hypothetical protein
VVLAPSQEPVAVVADVADSYSVGEQLLDERGGVGDRGCDAQALVLQQKLLVRSSTRLSSSRCSSGVFQPCLSERYCCQSSVLLAEPPVEQDGGVPLVAGK